LISPAQWEAVLHLSHASPSQVVQGLIDFSNGRTAVNGRTAINSPLVVDAWTSRHSPQGHRLRMILRSSTRTSNVTNDVTSIEMTSYRIQKLTLMRWRKPTFLGSANAQLSASRLSPCGLR